VELYRKIQLGFALARIPDANTGRIESKLLRFEPPKNLKPITHLKNLSGQVDLESFLSKLLVE
jgi:hypothetical protein